MQDAVKEIGQAISGLIRRSFKIRTRLPENYGEGYGSVPRKRKKKRKKSHSDDPSGYSLGN